ncbi:PREDICTED: potassium voltage-gated channel subfamily H member 6-like [Nicrophorus vespilloides]|uniref:Potassium voltage-gated channel subfamily H member 6-like n=1 Tax=Nicrophorus vespilloides TaxID=110193 RepID=A0ABM1MP49_NICVS|nr:PREDICTED: potassium voltage-gated channel subfamily H member 6-like [Nicrophorus vespilloides]
MTILAMSLFIYVNTKMIAAVALIDQKAEEYATMMEGMQLYMNYGKMNLVTNIRFNEFLTLQWQYFNGVNEKTLFGGLSKILYDKIKINRFVFVLENVPLFKGLKPEILKALALCCETHFLPPDELIVYEGQIIKDLFIIEKGYCEMICSTSNRMIKYLGPMDSFCLMEMLLC